MHNHASGSKVRTFNNTILKALDSETITRLGLRQVNFEVRHEIEFPGKAIEHMYFVEKGIASMTTSFSDGTEVEAGMFGYESAIGMPALMGARTSLNRVYTQVAGFGYCCHIDAARREFERAGLFRKLTLRSVQCHLLHAIQSAGCNAKHNMEQRLARWLLICADRARTDTLEMSQDFLADMLGSTRASVTLAAGPLKQAGLIEYSRGIIHILDSERLAKRACECHGILTGYFRNLEEFGGFD